VLTYFREAGYATSASDGRDPVADAVEVQLVDFLDAVVHAGGLDARPRTSRASLRGQAGPSAES
jgi:hypothetical protein